MYNNINRGLNSHHHHHHKEHLDDAEIFKRRTLNAARRRKLIVRVLFAVLSVVATAIVLFVAYLYL